MAITVTKGEPVVHYKFDSGDGTTIKDHGLAQADADLVGDGYFKEEDEEVVPDEAYSVSGSGNHVKMDSQSGCARINSLLSDEITIAMNCYIGAAGAGRVNLMEFLGNDQEEYIRIFRSSNDPVGVRMEMNLDGDGEKADISTSEDPRDWYHIALTYSEHTAKLYVNGIAVVCKWGRG